MAKKGGTPENLDKIRTTEEARKRGRNGGIKSGETRRRKRDAKSAAKLVLECGENVAKNLKSMNISEEDFTNRVALMARLFTAGMSGNVTAMRTIIELAGELPYTEIENKRLNLEEKKFMAEAERKEVGNNAVDDWVAAVMAADEQENENEKQ